ncbi:UPF0280 family protein [Shimia abyssi]|uniref:Thiamine biosynthesis protein ApbE n=1 Tax=Shimia abyssi TaxID=1662395 RepID=A0A2P8F638_9RHOB|nr:UPF0280 family protein [Shimia abyssi]PSL17186.1 hypothetical protein CLV88_12038 [Shimia abyssi]
MGPQVAFLPDGRRLHLHHGPIDLIIDVTGPGRDAALRRAADRFDTILQELADELAMLRQPVQLCKGLQGDVARQMARATRSYLPAFVTPMAAVAGAVADEIARVIATVDGVETGYVNNGGDVALVLAAGCEMAAALGGGAKATITSESDVRGVATSGWRGRSLSLGIADSVTVLARDAAAADVAATLIANHVDLPGHSAVMRRPACEVFPDSDLGARLVTVDVGALRPEEVQCALEAGLAYARDCAERGLIKAAYLSLDGVTRVCGTPLEYLTKKERLDA